MKTATMSPGGRVNPCGLPDRDRRGEEHSHAREFAEGGSWHDDIPLRPDSCTSAHADPEAAVDKFRSRRRP